MKLLLLFGICLILCFQISHQFPSGTKEAKAPFRKDDEISVNTFSELQNKRLGKYWKSHGIRSVGESEDGIGNGVKIDSKNVDGEETELSKRGLIKKVYKKMEEKVKDPRNYVPILLKRNVKDELTDNNETPLVGVPSDFDLGSGVITDKDNIKPESENDIQVVKRGWFKKVWRKIKNVVVGSVLGMILKRSLDEQQQPIDTNEFDLLDSEDGKIDNIAFSDDIIEVHLGTDKGMEDKAESEKEIQIVKRGWFKKIRRKIKKVLTGAVVGSVIGSVVKRGNDDETKSDKSDTLPVLLKTLRLRPGTADEITEIVEKLGNNSKFQDAMHSGIFWK